MTWKMTSLCAIIAIRYLWVNHFFKIIENGILMKMDICLADFVTNIFQTTQNYAITFTQSISQWIAKIVIRLLSILPHCQGSHLPHTIFGMVKPGQNKMGQKTVQLENFLALLILSRL